MRKYYEIFKFNLKTKMNFKANYFFSLLSFTIHILVFNTLWDFILKGKTILGYTKPELIWYIIIGELITYSTAHNYRKISDMVKSGDVANMLTKPIDFVKYIFAEEASCLVNVIINIIFAAILGVVMAGMIKLSIVQGIMFIISILLAVVLWISIQVFIGLLAFITEENEAFYLIISKAMLLLVLAPLEFFPDIIQKILSILPTTYISYPAAKIFVHFNGMQNIQLLGGQIISLGFVLTIIYFLNKKGVENINVNGG
ncbi:MAG: ABC-2 family transporter protein [Clostridia bacterium]|nr:ABC-2 family transporter protein [Clostridia bacterium]MDD4387444.1 ABC-2 family transporter protein [Clostridia bacterium]